jgi:hypothetical protein
MFTDILQSGCYHWSFAYKVCRLKYNDSINPIAILKFNQDDFKCNCEGYANKSECVWFASNYDVKRDINKMKRKNRSN